MRFTGGRRTRQGRLRAVKMAVNSAKEARSTSESSQLRTSHAPLSSRGPRVPQSAVAPSALLRRAGGARGGCAEDTLGRALLCVWRKPKPLLASNLTTVPFSSSCTLSSKWMGGSPSALRHSLPHVSESVRSVVVALLQNSWWRCDQERAQLCTMLPSQDYGPAQERVGCQACPSHSGLSTEAPGTGLNKWPGNAR